MLNMYKIKNIEKKRILKIDIDNADWAIKLACMFWDCSKSNIKLEVENDDNQ